jgi:negative regulator of sigma E activity
MNTNSEYNDRSRSHPSQKGQGENMEHTNDLTGAMDMVKRDRFELLSAYLDGEVTATERKQVEEWLANDPSVQKLYSRLLKLRHSLRTLPIPQAEQPVEKAVEKVLERLQRRRLRLAGIFGSAAMAACALGALSNLFTGENRLPQIAQQPAQQTQPAATTPKPSGTGLMVAISINNPVITIPKTEKASPLNPNNQQKNQDNYNGVN